jgi:Na+-driven multidrug efflux pump
VAVAAALVGLILLFGRQLMGIFTTTDELIDLSMHLMRILAIGYVAMGVIQTLAGVMRGAGDTVTPMWLSILQTIGLRVPLAYLLCYLTRTPELPKGRSDMIYWSLMLSWLIGAVIHVIVYKRGKWKGKAVI